jgi:rRNA maturation endonuclease Nob1
MNDDLISRKALKMVIEQNQLVNSKLSIYDALKIIDNAPPIGTTIEDLISTLSVEELKATTWFKVDTPSGEAICFRREKTGHWIIRDKSFGYADIECSNCKRLYEGKDIDYPFPNFCEVCGAKMTKDEEAEK